MADPMAGIRSRHPGLREAVVADARITAQHRFERHEFHGTLDTVIQVLRLMWVSDAFLAHALYRLKAALQRRGIPVLPAASPQAGDAHGSGRDRRPGGHGAWRLHRARPGRVDGIVEIRRGAIISPWVTIGLRGGDWGGPTIGFAGDTTLMALLVAGIALFSLVHIGRGLLCGLGLLHGYATSLVLDGVIRLAIVAPILIVPSSLIPPSGWCPPGR